MFIEITNIHGGKQLLNCDHIVRVSSRGTDALDRPQEGSVLLLSPMMSASSAGERYLTNTYQTIMESYEEVRNLILAAQAGR